MDLSEGEEEKENESNAAREQSQAKKGKVEKLFLGPQPPLLATQSVEGEKKEEERLEEMLNEKKVKQYMTFSLCKPQNNTCSTDP